LPQTNALQQHRLGDDCLESSLTEEDLAISAGAVQPGERVSSICINTWGKRL